MFKVGDLVRQIGYYSALGRIIAIAGELAYVDVNAFEEDSPGVYSVIYRIHTLELVSKLPGCKKDKSIETSLP